MSVFWIICTQWKTSSCLALETWWHWNPVPTMSNGWTWCSTTASLTQSILVGRRCVPALLGITIQVTVRTFTNWHWQRRFRLASPGSCQWWLPHSISWRYGSHTSEYSRCWCYGHHPPRTYRFRRENLPVLLLPNKQPPTPYWSPTVTGGPAWHGHYSVRWRTDGGGNLAWPIWYIFSNDGSSQCRLQWWYQGFSSSSGNDTWMDCRKYLRRPHVTQM